MSLIPNEQYRIRKETKHFNRRGILGLTNFRLFWIADGSDNPDVELYYNHIRKVETVENLDARQSMLKIEHKDFRRRGKTELVFVFYSETHTEDSQFCKDNITTFMNRPQKHDDFHFLSAESQMKISILEKNPELLAIHTELVRTGKMSEDHFWKTSDEYKVYLKDIMNISQNPGKLTAIVRIPHRFVSNNTVMVDMLTKYKEDIFRQLPAVKKNYYHSVPHRKKEIEFWRNFWENQLLLGGAMSDALELTGECTHHDYSIEICEDLDSSYGICRPQMKPGQNFNQITQQTNNHSFYVISNTSKPVLTATPQIPSFQYVQSAEKNTQMVQDINSSDGWGEFVSNCFKNANSNQVFLSSAEAIETIRQIFQQIYLSRAEENEENSEACKYAMKIYQILKYFYAEFPLQKERIERLEVLLNIANKVYNEMRTKCDHYDSVASIEMMIAVAADRLQQQQSNFS